MHPSLPQTMTIENLSQWITENSVDSFTDKRPKPLTDDDIAEYEHKSSVCSRELDKLKAVEKEFKDFMKEGTPEDQFGEHQSITITIPATKGTKALNEERESADKIIMDGQIVESTQLYTIPYPEGKKMVVVDIQGKEYEHLTKDMTQDQLEKHGNLFVEDGPKEDMEEEVSDLPVVEEKPKKKKKDQTPFI